MRVPHYGRNPRQRSDFGGRALSITPGHNDFAAGILSADPPDSGTGVLFRGSSNCAGVQDYVAGSIAIGRPIQPQGPKLLLNGGAVGLGGPATEILYVKAGHGTILAYLLSQPFWLERTRRKLYEA